MSLIAAIGNLSKDVVAGQAARPGGTVFYAARAFAAIGADAHVAASCSALDRAGLVPQLEAFGLPVRWYEGDSTTAYSFRYEGDRRVMRQEAVGLSWSASQAVEAVGDSAWVHVGALTRGDFSEDTLAALAGEERKLLVDAHGLVRTAALGPLRMDGIVGAALRHISILKLNDEEADVLAGSGAPEGLRALGVPEVILTLGSRGAYAVTQDRIEHVPAHEVPEALDPTGAGDTFSAAYLAARAAGQDPLVAAHAATAAVAALLVGR